MPATQTHRPEVHQPSGKPYDWSALDAAPQFARFLHADTRVRVCTKYPDGSEYVRTGTVSRTTGWRPAYLLMHRSNSYGSSDVLGAGDKVTHVQRNGRYVPANQTTGLFNG